MGDLADMTMEWIGDDGSGPAKPEDYLDMSDSEMVKASSFVRSEKLKSIRHWFSSGHQLSKKQRWCLAFALCDHDNKYA